MKFIYYIILILISFNSLSSQINCDSLNFVCKNTNYSDTTRFEAINKLTENYLQKRQLDSVYYFAKLHYDYAIEKSNKKQIAAALINMGNSFYWKAFFTEAMEYFQKSLKTSEEINDEEGIANSLALIGGIYMNKDNFLTGIEYSQKALKIYEKIGSKLGIANTLRLIGSNYKKNNNYEKSKFYLEKCLPLYEELGNKNGIAFSIYYLGTIMWEQGDYNNALKNCQICLKIWDEIGDKNGVALSLIQIGKINLKTGNFQEAINNFNSAYKLWEEIGDLSGIPIALNSIGEYYNKTGLYNKAIKVCSKSLDYATLVGVMIEQKEACNCLYTAYKSIGDNVNAINYLEKMIIIKDSIFNIQNSDKATQLQLQYEFDKKEALTKLVQEKKDVITQNELQSQKMVRNGFIGGLIVLIIMFIIAIIRFREKKKLSDKLAIQNAEIENQKSIVDEKNEQIYDSIRYASTIQHAILPWDSTLQKAFRDIFIFYKPKDIVSGDSYWFQEVDGIKFLAVIDCTGHGIPGSMLTVIASSVLDDAVLSKRLTDTGEILTYMNSKVTEVLNQRLKENETRDGMELALIAVKDNKIQFSGAGRPLYLKNESFEIIKTDKRGIAGQTENDEYQFSTIEIEKSENLSLYLTSDGFADQMNEQSKKYSTKRFISFLESISDKSMSEQNNILENEFNSHKGSRNQIDDVTILGVRV